MHTLRRTLLKTLALAALPGASAFAKPSTPAALGALPAMPLPGLYADAVDPTPYLVSEKYDGVRGGWDGRTLRFRSGRVVPAPDWFTARLPPEPLDGELWLGRGRFDELSGLARKDVPVDAQWRQVRYMVFELPGAEGAFEARARRIAEIAGQTAWAQLVAVEHTPVADRADLRRRLATTLARGGEGLVLHLASAAYRTGRSDVMLKLKPSLDTEATVVAHHPGQGKYEGMPGALEVRTPQGRHFLIGSGLSDGQRRDPPAIGSVVTYRYRDLTSTGLPRFASFLRLHHGL
jgi:DNA ligase-1